MSNRVSSSKCLMLWTFILFDCQVPALPLPASPDQECCLGRRVSSWTLMDYDIQRNDKLLLLNSVYGGRRVSVEGSCLLVLPFSPLRTPRLSAFSMWMVHSAPATHAGRGEVLVQVLHCSLLGVGKVTWRRKIKQKLLIPGIGEGHLNPSRPAVRGGLSACVRRDKTLQSVAISERS